MPRVFKPAIQGEIDKRFAGEPMIIVEVEWTDGSPIAYSDRKLNGQEYPYPHLVSISPFDSTQIISGSGDSQQTTIVLNDIDGSIRNTMDSNDAHLRPVRIYMSFQGLNFASKALMFEGVVNSPMVWDEGARTVTFDVLSKLESVEAGFAMEDGDFPFIQPQDRNKPWPLVFGSVCNMKAVQVRGTRKGFLAEGVGVKDPTIEERLCQAYNLTCPVRENEATSSDLANNGSGPVSKGPGIGTGTDTSIGSGDTSIGSGNTGKISGGGSTPGDGSFTNVRQGKVDPACVKRRHDKICEILVEKEQQEQYVKTVFVIRGGEEFPQNEKITIQINEVRFEGIMVGETFTVSLVTHPDPKDNPPCIVVPENSWGYRYKNSISDNPTTVAGCDQKTTFDKDIVNGDGESWRYFNEFDRSNFIWLPPGTTVLLAEEAEVLNIVSLLPGTVDQVSAYRNFSDTSLLTTVDTDLYTVVTTDYGGYDVVEVVLNSPLSTIEDQDWDDDIYVSFTSSIGPNPADIIQWLVETYTDLTVDASSFASVKAALVNYPMGFHQKSRPKILDLIRDIAFQARCAVFIRDNVVSIVYLSAEPTSVKTLTEDDILPNTFKITHSQTEDLETRHTVSWQEGEAGIFKSDEVDLEFVLKHNVPKYGIFDSSYDYFTMNIFELVEKSATFWMIRNSNTWKFVEFETPMTHLNLDLFDAVTINLSEFQSKVVIQEARFNIDTNTISFKAWTPIRSGESEEYLWAWPAGQAPNAVHPLHDQSSEAGDGFSLQVIPPEGHSLRGAYDPDTTVLNTDGDKNPSDLDDTLPTLVCKVSTGNEISDEIEPEFDPFEPLAEESFADNLDNINAGGTGGGSEDSEDNAACGGPGPGTAGCQYEVTIHYITPDLITTVLGEGNCKSAGPCKQSVSGRPCTGPQHSMCHSFGALFAATAFHSSKKQEAEQLRRSCGYHTGVTAVLLAGNITGIEGGGPFGECQDVAEIPDPSHPAAGAGETKGATNV